MTATRQQLQEWLNAKEDEHLEFKEANANFHFDKLVTLKRLLDELRKESQGHSKGTKRSTRSFPGRSV